MDKGSESRKWNIRSGGAMYQVEWNRPYRTDRWSEAVDVKGRESAKNHRSGGSMC